MSFPVGITTQPAASSAVCPGGTVTASVSVSGTGPFTYQWYKGSFASPLTGQTAATLSLTNVQTTDTGSYSVVITSACNAVYSTAFNLTVNPLPVAILTASPSTTLSCTNNRITLSAPSGAQSYAFSGPNGPIASIGNTATLSHPGTYFVTVTSNGCTSSNSLIISSDQTPPTSPTLTAGNNGQLNCVVRSLTLTASPAGNYTYTFSNGATQIGTTNVATVNTPGIYTVVVTSSNGCTALSTTSVFSNTAASATLGVTGTLSCTSLSAALVATQGVVYAYRGPGNFGVTTASSSVTVNTPGSYSVLVTAANGCTASATATVGGSTSAPTTSLLASGTVTCTNPSATLTAAGGVSYLLNGQTNTTGTFTVSQAGMYSVVVTGQNSCTATASATVVGSTSIANISLIASGTITCANASATLTASAGADLTGVSYTLNGQTNQTGSFTVNAPGAYSVVVTGQNGCTATASATVADDRTTPVASLLASGTITCGNTSATLTASGGVSYALAGQSGLPATNSTGVFVVNAPGTYSIVLTGLNRCTATVSATVGRDDSTPTASLLASGTITCANTSATLTASGGVSYLLNGQTNTTGSFTVSQAGNYSVVVTGQNGCTATASATVLSDGATPSASLLASGIITCTNASATLTASGGAALLGVSYSLNGQINTTGVFVVTTPGTYSVVVTGLNGCTASATATVRGDASVPTPSLLASGTITCATTSATLTTSGGTSYTLSNGIVNTTGLFVVTTAGAYSVVVSAANGCTASTSATVLEDGSTPGATLLASGTITCTNASATLTAAAGSGLAGVSYSLNGQINTTGLFVVTIPGTYSVVVTGLNGCTTTATATVQSNTTLPMLTLSGNTTFCQGQTNSLTATGIGNLRWNTGETTPIVSVSATGLYGVTLTGPNGCVAQAGLLVMAVSYSTATPVPIPTSCGSPTATIGQALVVTGVTDVSCTTGSFRILTTGGNGQPINYAGIVGLSNVDPYNCMRFVDNADQLRAINDPATAIGPFNVRGMQVGGTASNVFRFDFKSYCASTMPPSTTTTSPPSSTTASPVPTGCGSPTNTLGQPLVVAGVTDVNCATGSFRILTTGGNGQPINFADIVGLTSVDPYNCVRVVDGADLVRAVNNPASDVGSFNVRGMQVGGTASSMFSFNFKQYCTGMARVATAEGLAELSVTVLGNPTLGESVELVVDNVAGESLMIRVIDIQGQPASEVTSLAGVHTIRQRVLLGRSSGVYLVQVSTPSRSRTVKVVRQ